MLHWTEDVKLPDGRIATLSRSQVLWGWEHVKHGRGNAAQTFEFPNPDIPSQVIKWAGTDHLSTLAVFNHDRQTYLLTKPQWGSSYDVFNCPDPPYLLYRHSAGTWEALPLHSAPLKTVAVNMTFSVFDAESNIRADPHQHLSVAETQDNWVNDHRTRYVLDLTGFAEQTYHPGSDCRKHNYLYAK